MNDVRGMGKINDKISFVNAFIIRYVCSFNSKRSFGGLYELRSIYGSIVCSDRNFAVVKRNRFVTNMLRYVGASEYTITIYWIFYIDPWRYHVSWYFLIGPHNCKIVFISVLIFPSDITGNDLLQYIQQSVVNIKCSKIQVNARGE
jgi:hypothetical protein